MKIFNKNGKINYVDENNVVVGFDDTSCCCEVYGSYFTYDVEYSQESEECEISEKTLDEYNFDPTYFLDGYDDERGGGGFVQFKTIHETLPDVYLILYNFHNGYYSHGFIMSGVNEIFAKGSL